MERFSGDWTPAGIRANPVFMQGSGDLQGRLPGVLPGLVSHARSRPRIYPGARFGAGFGYQGVSPSIRFAKRAFVIYEPAY